MLVPLPTVLTVLGSGMTRNDTSPSMQAQTYDKRRQFKESGVDCEGNKELNHPAEFPSPSDIDPERIALSSVCLWSGSRWTTSY